ncbi:uncharacterized protein LJ206_017641 isoform 3-T3 [Theristicus caerulescens]
MTEKSARNPTPGSFPHTGSALAAPRPGSGRRRCGDSAEPPRRSGERPGAAGRGGGGRGPPPVSAGAAGRGGGAAGGARRPPSYDRSWRADRGGARPARRSAPRRAKPRSADGAAGGELRAAGRRRGPEWRPPARMEAEEVTSRALARRHGVFQAGAAACTDAAGAVPPRGVPSRTTQRQHLRDGPGQARESRAHQSTGSASIATRAAGSERTVPAQMFSSSFSQLQSAAEFTRKPREWEESWPAEGPQQRAHASLAASWTGSDQHITTSLHFSTGITLPCVALQPSLWGSPAPIRILVVFRKTPPCRASWA